MLRDLSLKAVYRTDSDDLLQDFYIPALSTAVSYKRAVGYFSAAMLSCAAQGLSAFLANNGQMQLVFGGELESEEAIAISRGYEVRAVSERLGLRILSTIESVADALCYRRLETLAWLVASGKLEIKVALRERGMYHEKIGIFRDADGDAVVFQGSANESANALLNDFNFESINVFPSWHEALIAHSQPYIQGFERLWENKSSGTLVIPFPEAARAKLIRIAATCRYLTPHAELELFRHRSEGEVHVTSDNVPAVPEFLDGDAFALRPHQRDALNRWKAGAFRGMFAHATGSGKTITAIYAAVRMFETTHRLALVIAVPYQALADQWVAVLSSFRIVPIQAYGSRDLWRETLMERGSLFRSGALGFICVVVVNRTLQSTDFQRELDKLSGDHLMFVGDECHHHASLALSESLPVKAKLRLGLSATPEHYIDELANERLRAYYGSVVSVFSLADALSAGVITPYKYHVSLSTLDETETAEYIELSERIAALTAQFQGVDAEASENSPLRALLMRRARVIGGAGDKLRVLRELLQRTSPHALTLFYCGDGSVDEEESETPVRQVDLVTRVLYELGWKSAQFTAREPREQRMVLLDALKVGAIDALVAIRCLDEGIDVPACRTAYLLASSRNPKQFIQRRGRLLRRAPGKDHATIFDVLVRLPPALTARSPFERRLVLAELERVAEFARLATNASEVVASLLPLLKEYDLAHAIA